MQNFYYIVMKYLNESAPFYFVTHNHVTPYIKLICTATDCVADI